MNKQIYNIIQRWLSPSHHITTTTTTTTTNKQTHNNTILILLFFFTILLLLSLLSPLSLSLSLPPLPLPLLPPPYHELKSGSGKRMHHYVFILNFLQHSPSFRPSEQVCPLWHSLYWILSKFIIPKVRKEREREREKEREREREKEK